MTKAHQARVTAWRLKILESVSRRRRNVAHTIVGVTPPGLFGLHVGRTFDVAIPLRARGSR
jgi:hypothetical protein